MSWCVVWKYQRSFPFFRFSAMIESVKSSAPAPRITPEYGIGFPTATYARPSAGSTVGVFHMAPPPRKAFFSGHVQ